jgi:hypothetical protein
VKGSARRPRIINRQKIGLVLKARYKADKSGGEAWLDEARAKKIAPKVVQNLINGKKVEVSTGLKLIRKKQEGIYNGKEYKFIGIQHRPDHLAILPDGRGACSVEDGAGLLQVLNQLTRQVRKLEKGMKPGKDVTNSPNGDTAVKTKFDKKKRISRLIKNGQFEERDRKALLALPDATVRKMKVVVQNEEDEDDPTPAPAKKPTPGEKSIAAQIAALPPVLQNLVRNSMKTEKRQKKELVDEILAVNTKKKFTKEFLYGKTVDELEGIASIARVANAADGYDDEPESGGGHRRVKMYGPYTGAEGVTNEEDDDEEEEEDDVLNDGPDFEFDNPMGDSAPTKRKKSRA